MNKRHQRRLGSDRRPTLRTAIALLLTAMILTTGGPELTATALYLLTDGITTAVTDGTERVDAERIVLPGATADVSDVTLEGGRKVTIRVPQRGEKRGLLDLAAELKAKKKNYNGNNIFACDCFLPELFIRSSISNLHSNSILATS